MDQLPPLGRDILGALLQTFTLYGHLQTANKEAILSTPRTEYAYGDHPRQKVDVYQPTDGRGAETSARIMVFLYGGGLERGDKIMAHPPGPEGGLTYANVGHYFASKGFLTLIPDYRRVRPDEGAVYPSGGTDVATLLAWLATHLSSVAPSFASPTITPTTTPAVYLMGTSAGAVHAATFLLAPDFRSDVDALAHPTGAASTSSPLHLAGITLVSPPCSFEKRAASRAGVLDTYYGAQVVEHSLTGLVQGFGAGTPGVRVLVVSGSLDPEDEILETVTGFEAAWRRRFGAAGLEAVVLEGHNHFSTVLGLGTGIAGEEGLGRTMLEWMERK